MAMTATIPRTPLKALVRELAWAHSLVALVACLPGLVC
ncbi:hypothetical protein AOX55_00003897 [Sinorhizobium fredii CCBAU 25509]|nr:hypothetical protein SF83666_c36650 [Sinorhizobium fredii CCBAU 83666]ASY71867.1 hypothetical protein SF83666_b52180 [Sinorhizobium fredii CCBAU 83666]AWM27121.1 hypothetical protein AOX55_00003897 [Sinorhizobium fredii CCBAU 25509]